ncbi:Hypothetical Protein FCC1311_060762 [Hondaea fermentalgiana]|uniref:Uncharacterized protein n=1 Tax=Hondaea fermentalgiana TaxID=2315210 RepID=A0A2R5GG19_9STRA|nr:Hypothetical Protein FCC1311_060762 [Hondaea fermentalgiana]|eukprot:GBG29856.1 Hypothetical Protein FCC1311_060762 [Hondaea fermentalgiana]
MRKHLKDWNIPLIGIYCDAIDSDCFLPPRYVRTSAEDKDHGDAHRARLSQALSGALDELEWAHFVPCLQPVSDLLCKDFLVRGDGAILVPKHVFDRWDLVEPQALEEWISAGSQASRVSEKAVQENLLALERASGEFSRVQLGEVLVSHLRQGLLSPFAAARRLRGSQSSLVDRLLFSRECEVLRAYRAFKESIGKFDLSPPWTMGTGAPIQLLRVSHGASLPGDLEDGASADHTWNIIQKRILEDGVIWNEAANARYWVDQLVDWSAKPEIGLYLVLRWAAKHIIVRSGAAAQRPDT